MEIGLIQIDGNLPNLALMKISRWHKNRGDNVYLMKGKVVSTRLIPFDKVYISCIFEENKQIALDISKQFKNAVVGGIGVNNIKLSEEMEHLMPDYDIFNCGFSMGFATRGCIRKCEFCKVPKHEGIICKNADIYEFWNRDHTHIVLMDNNILALPSHFETIARQIKENNLSVDFNQGLDIRLLNDKNAKILSELRVKPRYRFAFDNIDIEDRVIKGINMLDKYGIKDNLWYVLVGFDSDLKNDLHRINLLKSLNQRVYVMRHKNVRGEKIYNDLASWANQPQFFMALDFDKFREIASDRTKIIRKIKDTGNSKMSDYF